MGAMRPGPPELKHTVPDPIAATRGWIVANGPCGPNWTVVAGADGRRCLVALSYSLSTHHTVAGSACLSHAPVASSKASPFNTAAMVVIHP